MPIEESEMYHHDGHDLFVIDGHMHFWDANPENWKNKYGESWIKCFYAYHSNLSPAEAVWPFDKFCRYGEKVMVDDLFRTGYVDMAILNSTYLYEFYKNGFRSRSAPTPRATNAAIDGTELREFCVRLAEICLRYFCEHDPG